MLYFNVKSLSFIKKKFSIDLFWNVLSFGLIAICGLGINTLITLFYGFEILGYFNIVYALYILLSQISVWGIHLAIQKYIPQFSKSLSHIKEIFTAGFIMTFIFACVIIFFVAIFNKLPGTIMSNLMLEKGFVYAVPGLLFFSLNKCMLSYLNGMRLMKSFAFFNALRAFLMLLYVIVFYYKSYDLIYLSLVFTIPETALFILLFVFNSNKFVFSKFKRLLKTSKLLFRHANRAAIGNIVLDLNSKIDILVLGIFVNASQVGIYSFAVFVVDGFSQVFYVFRNNINPILTKAYYYHSKELFVRIIKTNIRKFYKIFSIFGFLLLLFYPIFLYVFGIKDFYFDNTMVFTILLTGAVITSGYIPFQMIFNQIGLPKKQTKFLIFTFSVNLIFNFGLIPIFGIYGAAVAVVLSYFFQVIYINRSIKKMVFVKF